MVFRPSGAFSTPLSGEADGLHPSSMSVAGAQGWLVASSYCARTSFLVLFDLWSSAYCLRLGTADWCCTERTKLFFLLHIPWFRSFSANLHLFPWVLLWFHHRRYVVLAAALPLPCVWCHTTRRYMWSAVHLPSIWYLQFYICGFIFIDS